MPSPRADHTVVHELVRDEVLRIAPYNAGLSDDAVRARYSPRTIVRLASNENPLGMSAAVPAAIRECATAVYPDARCEALRAALAVATGIAPNRIVTGNGSEDIIKMLCEAFLEPGDRVVTASPSFGLHESCPTMMGATVDLVPITSALTYDVPALAAALRCGAKMLLLGNPSNPVGCVLDTAGLRTLIDAAPADALIVIDEAYYEFAAGTGYADSIALLAAQHRPWIVLRTFSKAYGLAGLRAGYGLASDPSLVDLLNRVRTPFNVNAFAQVAAIAALRDADHVERTVALVAAQRDWMREQLGRLGLEPAPSRANFLFVDLKRNAADVAEQLLAHGIIVKPWKETGYESFLRISIGTPADNAALVTALRTIMQPKAAQ
ncbi:histidinol-phosphate aminotransferase [Burkholderia cepacia]|uniref:histidinol-phosphate transaminase n=1 Tax=Burkholderia cepacia TaxID=292 RepID=UPI0007546CA7|nr:histidinol-phosphate transaminase [Burkholderia cepacia]KVL51676.1 histidinol-phosphate aminotransferase [Burkholderia cepacia]